METSTRPASEPEDPDAARQRGAHDGGRLPATIGIFRGPWAFLSNYHRAVLRWDGQLWPTDEHAFNAGKTLDHTWRTRIRQAPTPGQAKRLGRAAPLRPDWHDRVRYEVMAQVVAAKFVGVPRVQALLSTGDAELVEGNRWHDQHWGDCRCGRPACAKPGLNHLGRILMAHRAELASRGAS